MARAKPPSVMALIVFHVTYRPMIEPRIASGIDMLAIKVMRQLPRKIRIMIDTSTAPMIPSSIRLDNGLLHRHRLIHDEIEFGVRG